MPWPFPVIGISAEFSHAFRCANQPDIFIHFIHVHQVLVVFEHTVYPGRYAIFFIAGLFDDLLVYILQFFTRSAQLILYTRFYLCGHILDPFQELYRQVGLDLLILIESIEPVSQIVMFYATGCCNGGISAMVIGEDKP